MGGEVGGGPSLAQRGGVRAESQQQVAQRDAFGTLGGKGCHRRGRYDRATPGSTASVAARLVRATRGRGPRGPGTTLGAGDPRALPDPWSTPPPSWPIASRVPAAGSIWWVAPVRDAFADDPAAAPGHALDFDLTTDAAPDEIERLVRGWADAVWLQGKRFGTVGAAKDGRRFEITTHRAEVYTPDSRKPEVAFGDSIEVDLSRRDFTVNAMALRLPDLELVDPFDGLADLAARRLRTPLDPEVSFADDPLRMLRAARFIAGFGLEPRRRPRGRREGHARPPVHRVGRAHPRRARQAARRWTRPSPGLWFLVETGPGRRVPARAARPGARAGPHPPPQGRPRPHPGGGGQDGPGPAAAAGRAAARHRQAPHTCLRPRRRHLPPPRGGRRPHGPRTADGAALPARRHRRRHAGSWSCTCASTPTDWGGPTGPCAATCATPALCSTG